MPKGDEGGGRGSLFLPVADDQERGRKKKDKRQQQRPFLLKAGPGQDKRGTGRHAISCLLVATCRRTEGIESRKKLPAGHADLPAMLPAWRGNDRRHRRGPPTRPRR